MRVANLVIRDVRIADRSAGGVGSARILGIRGYPRIQNGTYAADADYPRIPTFPNITKAKIARNNSKSNLFAHFPGTSL